MEFLDSLNAGYDMVAILSADRDSNQSTTTVLDNLPEYIGKVKMEKVDGKGRGVLATEDIFPGQLIIVAKAVAILFTNDKDDANANANVDKIGKLSQKIGTVIKENSDMASKVYNLYAGPELGWLELDGAGANAIDGVGVDMERIEGICALNGFETDPRGELNETCYGLWYFPAFLNHACYGSNAQWRIFKNLMLIRATKLIPKGCEVLITYFDPNRLYSERQRLLQKHEFRCDCLFCDIEESEEPAVLENRDVILSQFMKNSDNDKKDMKWMLGVIDELEKLRPQYPELNVFLVRPLLHLGLMYYGKAEWKHASEAFVKVMDLCKYSAQLSLLGLSCAVAISTCYYRLKESRELIQEWINVSKQCAIIEYGTDQILENLRPAFVKEMKSAGYL